MNIYYQKGEIEMAVVRRRNRANQKLAIGFPKKYLKLIGLQGIICAVIIIIGIAFKFLGGSAYQTSRLAFSNAVTDKMNIDQISKSISINVPQINSVIKYIESMGSKAQGGSDIVSVASKNGLRTPPENCILAPVYLTVKPIIPVDGELTSGFGYRIHPITKKLGFHTGVDIGADEGTPIKAAFNGTVVEVGVSNAYGNYIILDHGNGIKTFYGHCSALLAPKDAVIRAGETIAYVGNTGLSTGPHLHFEIRFYDKYINPAPLLWR
jgi:murein DD-endopeptidase MepM/ murein hydrolase activator NlpD